MLYKFIGNQIYATNNHGFKFLQDRDPSSQKFFKSQEEALLCLEKLIEDMYCMIKAEAVCEFKDEEGNIINKAGIKSNIEVSILTSMESFTGTTKIDILKNDAIFKTVDIELIEGKGQTKLSLDEAGEYSLAFDYAVSCNNNQNYILHEAEAFKITIK